MKTILGTVLVSLTCLALLTVVLATCQFVEVAPGAGNFRGVSFPNGTTISCNVSGQSVVIADSYVGSGALTVILRCSRCSALLDNVSFGSAVLDVNVSVQGDATSVVLRSVRATNKTAVTIGGVEDQFAGTIIRNISVTESTFGRLQIQHALGRPLQTRPTLPARTIVVSHVKMTQACGAARFPEGWWCNAVSLYALYGFETIELEDVQQGERGVPPGFQPDRGNLHSLDVTSVAATTFRVVNCTFTGYANFRMYGMGFNELAADFFEVTDNYIDVRNSNNDGGGLHVGAMSKIRHTAILRNNFTVVSRATTNGINIYESLAVPQQCDASVPESRFDIQNNTFHITRANGCYYPGRCSIIQLTNTGPFPGTGCNAVVRILGNVVTRSAANDAFFYAPDGMNGQLVRSRFILGSNTIPQNVVVSRLPPAGYWFVELCNASYVDPSQPPQLRIPCAATAEAECFMGLRCAAVPGGGIWNTSNCSAECPPVQAAPLPAPSTTHSVTLRSSATHSLRSASSSLVMESRSSSHSQTPTRQPPRPRTFTHYVEAGGTTKLPVAPSEASTSPPETRQPPPPSSSVAAPPPDRTPSRTLQKGSAHDGHVGAEELDCLVPPVAMDVIVSVGAGAAAVGAVVGVVSPPMATQPARLAAASLIARCLEDREPPSTLSHPLSVLPLLPRSSTPDSTDYVYLNAALTSCALVAVFLTLYGGGVFSGRQGIAEHSATWFIVALAYAGPSITAAATGTLYRTYDAWPVNAIAFCFIPTCLALVAAAVRHATLLHRKLRAADHTVSAKEEPHTVNWAVVLSVASTDGLRSSSRSQMDDGGAGGSRALMTRHYYLADVGGAAVVGALCGVQPYDRASACMPLGAAATLLLALQCGLVCVVRPFEGRRENVTAVIVAAAQTCLGGVGVWTMANRLSSSSGPSNPLTVTLGRVCEVIELGLSALYFVDVVIAAAFALREKHCGKQPAQPSAALASTAGATPGSLAAPLLEVPHLPSSTSFPEQHDPPTKNPLAPMALRR
jgi:hypothetical protein